MPNFTPEQLITLAILAGAILLFVTEWLRVDLVALCVVVALILTGVLDVSAAVAGFSNPVVLTIAALFVVGGAVLQTGLAAQVGERILKIAGNSPARLMFVIMAAAALLSSFLSDTGTVAVLLPAAIVLARGAQVSPSRLLIPLSYGALLGGAMTLIGTAPNLVVSDLLRQNGLPPFTFFSFTPLGILLFIAGSAFMLAFGRRLLPDRQPTLHSQPVENPGELIDRYRLPGNLFRLRVRRTSGLVGEPLAESGLGAEFNVNVLEILRRRTPRPLGGLLGRGADEDRQPLDATPETCLQSDDLLVAQGSPADITRAAARWDLGVQPVAPDEGEDLINQEIGIAEVLLPASSSLLGQSVVVARFGTLYHLNVLGLERPGRDHPGDLRHTPLHFGDLLLVQGPWQHIAALRRHGRDFVVLGQPEAFLAAPRQKQAGLALLVMAGMLVVMIFNLLPLAAASLLAALLMVLFGCLTMDEAYQSVDWKSIVLVACMLPMSTALEKVALVELAAHAVTASLGALGPLAVLAALFLLTATFTQVLSNTATAVLVAPIALAAAHTLGVQPQAFLMAVGVAASMAFASPVASPVNTLVMAAGHYRFSDYLKAGLPMIAIALLVSVLALPLLFPF